MTDISGEFGHFTSYRSCNWFNELILSRPGILIRTNLTSNSKFKDKVKEKKKISDIEENKINGFDK